jgi:hypothetical protein
MRQIRLYPLILRSAPWRASQRMRPGNPHRGLMVLRGMRGIVRRRARERAPHQGLMTQRRRRSLRRGTAGRRTLARRANHGAVARACPVPRAKINHLIVSAIQKYGPHVPPQREGRFGQSSPNVSAGCDGRGRSARKLLRGRLTLLRTAKSCGPFAPTLATSWADDVSATTGARKPGPRGDHV